MFPEVNGIIRCRKFFEREGHRGDEWLYQNRIHSICCESVFVRKSKKNEFELFWGNETGGGGKVGRDVSEAFGFLSR